MSTWEVSYAIIIITIDIDMVLTVNIVRKQKLNRMARWPLPNIYTLV